MNLILKPRRLVFVLLAGASAALGCGGSATSIAGRDASTATGGAAGANSAGATGTGGNAATGGSPPPSTGGTSQSTGGAAMGGVTATGGLGQDTGPPDANFGGTSGTAGASASGGSLIAGSTISTGGSSATAGTIVEGGSTSTTGGKTTTGGSTTIGGSTATGGKTATGGATVAGGSKAPGGSTASGGTSAGSTGTGGAATAGWVTIHNDFFWYDDTGAAIETRAGCLRKFGDTYYWYGLFAWQDPKAWNDQTCYASTDLVHWTNKGIALHVVAGANRMDVLYNDTTKKYVMFLKYGGDAASLGFATSSTPEGPYTLLSETQVDGANIGDMSMYEDDDGKAYLAYVWDQTGPNRQHGIYRMSADYLSLDTQMYLWNEASREAPHIFKRNGTYYYGISETNGVNPSPTRYYTATNLAGPWSAATMLSTPGSSTTYETQVDFVFPFTGTQGTVYMFDGDRWLPTGGSQGGYVWLPYQFGTALMPTMPYYQDWDLNMAAGTWRTFDSSRNLALGKTATASSDDSTNVAASVTKATTYQNYTATRWESAASDPQWIMVDLGAATEIDRAILKWHTDYGKAFKIQVSTDATAWTDVYSTTIGASYSVTDVTFSKTSARYVRMYGTQRGTTNGYSLFAFMVLDDP
jgi:hypothetical protein